MLLIAGGCSMRDGWMNWVRDRALRRKATRSYAFSGLAPGKYSAPRDVDCRHELDRLLSWEGSSANWGHTVRSTLQTA